ncbi:MAG TPA: hypothetical protein VEC57_16870 [Candidatus Limnocylindrales bacterium]|nr:hypothetical protein [Candidatus Limnocylindrales bacterium]
MTTKLRTTLILAIATLPLAVQAPAQELTRKEMMCRRQISETGRGYIEMTLEARIGCQNRAIKGRIDPATDCTTGDGDKKLQKDLDRTALVLGREMHEICDEVDLGALGYPGPCAGDKGIVFDVDDLEDCIAEQAQPIVTTLLDFYFPPIDRTYGGDRLICLRQTPRQAFRMFRGDLRTRDDCSLAVIAGSLPGNVQCRNDVFAWGPGTGDDLVDAHIHRAYVELLNAIPEECSFFDIDELGYQDVCLDETGGNFSVVDLKECLFNENRDQVQEALNILFPQ